MTRVGVDDKPQCLSDVVCNLQMINHLLSETFSPLLTE